MYNSHIIIFAVFAIATIFADSTIDEVSSTTTLAPTTRSPECRHKKEINDALNNTMNCFNEFVQEQLYKNGQMCKTLDEVKHSLNHFFKIKSKCLKLSDFKRLSENQKFLEEFLEFSWKNNKTIDFLIKHKGLQCTNEKRLSIRSCFLQATGYLDNSTKYIIDFGDITKLHMENTEPSCSNFKRLNKCIKTELLTEPTNCTRDNLDFMTSLSDFVSKGMKCIEKEYPPPNAAASYSTSTIGMLIILGAIVSQASVLVLR